MAESSMKVSEVSSDSPRLGNTQSEAFDNREDGFASEKQNSSVSSPYLKGWRLYWTATG